MVSSFLFLVSCFSYEFVLDLSDDVFDDWFEFFGFFDVADDLEVVCGCVFVLNADEDGDYSIFVHSCNYWVAFLSVCEVSICECYYYMGSDVSCVFDSVVGFECVL